MYVVVLYLLCFYRGCGYWRNWRRWHAVKIFDDLFWRCVGVWTVIHFVTAIFDVDSILYSVYMLLEVRYFVYRRLLVLYGLCMIWIGWVFGFILYELRGVECRCFGMGFVRPWWRCIWIYLRLFVAWVYCMISLSGYVHRCDTERYIVCEAWIMCV